MRLLKTAAGILLVLCTTAADAISQDPDTLHLQSDKLKLVVASNQSYGDVHRAGYSGISELYRKNNRDKNLFVPSFCGLNLEFIFSGDSRSFDWNLFEPRKSPMHLVRLSSNEVQLKQIRTEHWPLRSTITYALSGNLVEMRYTGIPLEDAWSKFNYIGLFFASYINKPEQIEINFIGKTRSDADLSGVEWVDHLPPEHGVAANHRPAGSNWDPSYDPGFPLTLVSGYSKYEYIYPFYFGRSGENVVIMMFQNLDENSELRFAQSPTGGGPNHPAWDFIYFKKGYRVDKPFGFKVGMIVKKFEGKADVIRQYEKWSGETVKERHQPE